MACCIKATMLLIVLMSALLTEANYSKNDVGLFRTLSYKCRVKEFQMCSGGNGRRNRWLCECPTGYRCNYSPDNGAFLCLPEDPTSDYDSVINRIA